MLKTGNYISKATTLSRTISLSISVPTGTGIIAEFLLQKVQKTLKSRDRKYYHWGSLPAAGFWEMKFQCFCSVSIHELQIWRISMYSFLSWQTRKSDQTPTMQWLHGWHWHVWFDAVCIPQWKTDCEILEENFFHCIFKHHSKYMYHLIPTMIVSYHCWN